MSTYSLVGIILQRDLRIELGEESIWSRLDTLGQISARLMIHIPLYGNWVMITPKFGTHKHYYTVSQPEGSPPPYQHSSHSNRTIRRLTALMKNYNLKTFN